MSKNVKLEQNFKNDFIMNDDLVFSNHNETDVLIREEAQFLASQLNSSKYFDSSEDPINEKILIEVDNQDKLCSIIEKNNTVLTKLLDKMDNDSNKVNNLSEKNDIQDSISDEKTPCNQSEYDLLSNSIKDLMDKENSFYEHSEKNNSTLLNYFKNEISNIKQLIKNDKIYINETNKEILNYLENQLIVNDVLNNKDFFEKIEKSIDSRVTKNNSILNRNFNIWTEEIITKIQDLKNDISKNNYKEELDYLLNAQSENINSIATLKEDINKNNYREELDYLLNAQSENVNSITTLKEDINKNNYREELDYLLNAQSENVNSITTLKEDINKNNYREELDYLLNAQSSNVNLIATLKDDVEKNIQDKFTKNNSILNKNFNSLIEEIKSTIHDLKDEITKSNHKEELEHLSNKQTDSENSIATLKQEIESEIENKFTKNNSILNDNINLLVEELKSKIYDLKEEIIKLDHKEELEYLSTKQTDSENSIVTLKHEFENEIENRFTKNNSILNRNFNSLIEDLKYEIQDIKTEINGLNYRDELDELLHIQNKSEDSIGVITKDIDSRIDELESELKKLNYRKELDGLLEAQFHYIENANTSKKEIQEKINYIENDFLERIQNIEYKLSSNLSIINELKNSHDSNEIDNLITDKLVTIVEEKINTIDSKMTFLKKEIENNLNDLIEKQFETNIIKNNEYNKKIKNETLNIIYNELNKFNDKFENLNEEIIKNYDLLMINNRVLDTLEDLLSDQYSKKNDLDIERKNLIDELIKKAEHNKELIIILQNKIDYSIDNTDLYNSIIRKTISRDSDFLREVDDQTYNYVKNLTLELVSKELSKYTNFVKNDNKELEVEQIELNLVDDSLENKTLDSEVLENDEPILTIDEIIESEILEDESISAEEPTIEEPSEPILNDEIIEPEKTLEDESIAIEEPTIEEPSEPILTDDKIIEPETLEDESISVEEPSEPILTDDKIIEPETLEDESISVEEPSEPILTDDKIIEPETLEDESISVEEPTIEESSEPISTDDKIIEPEIKEDESISVEEPTIEEPSEPILSNNDNESLKSKTIEDTNIDVDSSNDSKSAIDDGKIFKNDNPYFNYKIKELLLELMTSENESITNDIAFYKTNLLNQNSDYLDSEFYVQELENYFSTVKNVDEDNFNKGESNG